jgi:hypothetical protein
VAVFDVTNPRKVSFLDMIVTPGDLAPEGVAPGASTTNTTLYRIDPVRRHHGRWE